MKFTLFSDIDGNIYAFEAMISALSHEDIETCIPENQDYDRNDSKKISP